MPGGAIALPNHPLNTALFDGYENNSKSIKISERQYRRLNKKCTDVFF